MPISGVPVKMYGNVVGTAQIDDDGGITVEVDGPNQLGQDVLERLEAGEFSALNLLPEGVDRPPVSIITAARAGREATDEEAMVNSVPSHVELGS